MQTFRAEGDRATPVDLGSAEGLTEHLTALDHRVHPAAALAEFAKRANEATLAFDLLLVTGEDVWADPEFARALAETGLDGSPATWHLALVQREGGFRLLQRSRGGTKVLREARFELDEVLKPRPKVTRLLDPGRAPLPAICGVSPFPLRLPHPVRIDNSWLVHGAGGTLTLTSDGRLLRWNRPKRGPEQLMEGLPPGRLHWCAVEGGDRGFATLVIGKLSRTGLYSLRFDLTTGDRTCHRLDLPFDQPRFVRGHNGVLLVLFREQVAAMDPIRGTLRDWRNVRLPANSRMYPIENARSGADEWWAVSFDGEKLREVAVCRHVPHRPPFVAMLELPEGPVGLTGMGELVYLERESRRTLSLPSQQSPGNLLPCQMIGLSRDGQRLALKHFLEVRSFAVVNIVSGGVWLPRSRDPLEALEQPMFHAVSERTLRTHFTGITVDAQRRLTLVARRGTFWTLRFDGGNGTFVFPREPAAEKPTRPVLPFVPLDTDRGYALSEARWPDGSRAVLDGRGLLHLQSADRSIPEVTIVLVEGATAGWTSEGLLWGPTYFTNAAADVPASAAYAEAIRPFIDRLNIEPQAVQ